MAQEQRPFIHINLAMGSDGLVASPQGHALPLSCLTDWRRVHGLRERCDAVAVGAKTWIMDSPRLTARHEHLGREPRRQPARVIFAGSHRCVVVPDGRPTFVFGSGASGEGEITFIRTQGWRLREPLERLRSYGVRSLLVEGGPTLLRSFLEEDLHDLVTLYVRTDRPEAAHMAARNLFGELSMRIEAETLGEGILLVGGADSPRREWTAGQPESNAEASI
jgi:riboflavin biosynthesis pyrimidine reductase